MLERVAARDEEQRRLRENPEFRAEMARKEREAARAEAERRRAERERQKRDERPVFDADSWRPTEKALEMLARLEGGAGAAADAAQDDVASANERRYAGVVSYVDRAIDKYNAHTGTAHGRYDTIAAAQGTNGDCHSRKTTYRRFKFGKGSISERGWMRQGFQQNTDGGTRHE
jgi:hypothetical protein